MIALRRVFLAACIGCVAIVAWRGHWQGRLIYANHTWIVDLSRAPIWAPPAVPPYSMFWEDFEASEGFPPEGASGVTIQRVLMLDWMAVDLLLDLWVVTIAGGLLYLAVRGERRDLILHVGLSAGICLTVGAAASIGLWLLCGGWGPPAPGVFGGLSLIVGFVAGLLSFKPGTAR
jgi:hypothetical protein